MRIRGYLALIGAGLVGFLPACSDGDPSAAGGPNPGDTATVERQANLVSSLALEGGNVVEFYDFGSRALISEVGNADSRPQLDTESARHKSVIQVWNELAYGQPVPQALKDLDVRLNTPPAQAVAVEPVAVRALDKGGALFEMPVPAVQNEGDDSLVAAPTGCNNGCCDYDWLKTLTVCKAAAAGGGDYNWFLFNYGWSYANSTSISLYQGLVCSASGTSSYHVNIGGSGGTWSVLEATWRTYSWSECLFFCSDQNSSTSVNSSSNQHLHTYCGSVNY